AAATPRLPPRPLGCRPHPVASLPPASRCPRIPSEAVAHTSEGEVWGGDKRALIRLVGDPGAKKLQQLDIHSPQDLLRHYPRKYFHRSRYTRLRDLVSGEHATVMAQVLGVEDFRPKKRPLHVIKVSITDGDTVVPLTFFARRPYMVEYFKKQFRPGISAMFSGQVTYSKGALQLSSD